MCTDVRQLQSEAASSANVPLDWRYPAGHKSAWDMLTDRREFDRMAPITRMVLGAGFVTSMEQLLAEGSREPISHKFGPEFLGSIGARIQGLIQSYLKERPGLPVRELR